MLIWVRRVVQSSRIIRPVTATMKGLLIHPPIVPTVVIRRDLKSSLNSLIRIIKEKLNRNLTKISLRKKNSRITSTSRRDQCCIRFLDKQRVLYSSRQCLLL